MLFLLLLLCVVATQTAQRAAQSSQRLQAILPASAALPCSLNTPGRPPLLPASHAANQQPPSHACSSLPCSPEGWAEAVLRAALHRCILQAADPLAVVVHEAPQLQRTLRAILACSTEARWCRPAGRCKESETSIIKRTFLPMLTCRLKLNNVGPEQPSANAPHCTHRHTRHAAPPAAHRCWHTTAPAAAV